MISLYDTSDNISDLDDSNKKSTSVFKLIILTIQTLIFGSLLLFFFGLGAHTILGYTTFIDYANKCFIKVDKDILKGNRETVFKALSSIKNNNFQEYNDICNYVDTIAEAACLVGENNSGKLHPLNTDGCYIKGTKTIFISPDNSDLDAATTARKSQILKYSKMSKNYWLSSLN